MRYEIDDIALAPPWVAEARLALSAFFAERCLTATLANGAALFLGALEIECLPSPSVHPLSPGTLAFNWANTATGTSLYVVLEETSRPRPLVHYRLFEGIGKRLAANYQFARVHKVRDVLVNEVYPQLGERWGEA